MRRRGAHGRIVSDGVAVGSEVRRARVYRKRNWSTLEVISARSWNACLSKELRSGDAQVRRSVWAAGLKGPVCGTSAPFPFKGDGHQPTNHPLRAGSTRALHAHDRGTPSR